MWLGCCCYFLLSSIDGVNKFTYFHYPSPTTSARDHLPQHQTAVSFMQMTWMLFRDTDHVDTLNGRMLFFFSLSLYILLARNSCSLFHIELNKNYEQQRVQKRTRWKMLLIQKCALCRVRECSTYVILGRSPQNASQLIEFIAKMHKNIHHVMKLVEHVKAKSIHTSTHSWIAFLSIGRLN